MQKCVGIYDSKAVCVVQKFYFPNEAVAIRDFAEACADPKSPLFRHPEDFSLVYMADFDEFSGDYENKPNVTLAEAIQFVKEVSDGENIGV